MIGQEDSEYGRQVFPRQWRTNDVAAWMSSRRIFYQMI